MQSPTQENQPHEQAVEATDTLSSTKTALYGWNPTSWLRYKRSVTKRIARWLEFTIVALEVAVFLCRIHPRELFQGVRGFIIGTVCLLRPSEEGQSAARRLWRSRLRTCNKCMVYDRKRRTCGHLSKSEIYQDPNTGQKKTIGCLCIIPIKAKNPQATCWAREKALDFGWKE